MKFLKKRIRDLIGCRLAITNEKGGVGKTTYSHHISILACEAGLKVLAVDFDPQGNLSSVVSGHQLPPAHILSAHLTASTLFGEELPDLPLLQPQSNLFLLPADARLADIESIPFETGVVLFPMQYIDYLVYEYQIDLVIIDTPPVAGNRQIAGVLASTNVLVPMELTQFSVDGISSVYERLQTLCKQLQQPLPRLTLLPNRVNTRAKKSGLYLQAITDNFSSVALPPLALRQPIADAADYAQPVWSFTDGNSRIATSNLKQQLLNLIKEIRA
jgi:chromosome partitioning protein